MGWGEVILANAEQFHPEFRNDVVQMLNEYLTAPDQRTFSGSVAEATVLDRLIHFIFGQEAIAKTALTIYIRRAKESEAARKEPVKPTRNRWPWQKR